MSGKGKPEENPFYQPSPVESQPHRVLPASAEAAPAPVQAPESSSSTTLPSPSEEDKKKWGTHIMGPPAVPTVHPDNQKAALWNTGDHQKLYQQPYIQYSPVDRPNNNPLESVCHMFNSWSSRAESIARNVWHNLKTGPSMSEAAWGKVNLTAKAITGGGFEALFKQIFPTADPNEKLVKSFACYLSTMTGPVAGTLYLSTARVGFCSDRPLCFTAPSGQEAWSYYKVNIPLMNMGTINPVVMKENPPENYIQVVTIDGHDFWFMGFVNYEKASHHLLNTLANFRAAANAAGQPVSG